MVRWPFRFSTSPLSHDLWGLNRSRCFATSRHGVKTLALSMSRLVVAVVQQLAMGADVASWIAEG
jgi:hypothetical protein